MRGAAAQARPSSSSPPAGSGRGKRKGRPAPHCPQPATPAAPPAGLPRPGGGGAAPATRRAERRHRQRTMHQTSFKLPSRPAACSSLDQGSNGDRRNVSTSTLAKQEGQAGTTHLRLYAAPPSLKHASPQVRVCARVCARTCLSRGRRAGRRGAAPPARRLPTSLRAAGLTCFRGALPPRARAWRARHRTRSAP